VRIRLNNEYPAPDKPANLRGKNSSTASAGRREHLLPQDIFSKDRNYGLHDKNMHGIPSAPFTQQLRKTDINASQKSLLKKVKSFISF
jgi:hypothetical protein